MAAVFRGLAPLGARHWSRLGNIRKTPSGTKSQSLAGPLILSQSSRSSDAGVVYIYMEPAASLARIRPQPDKWNTRARRTPNGMIPHQRPLVISGGASDEEPRRNLKRRAHR